VVVVDDLLATGGTAAAAVHLLEKLGARVLRILFIVELEALGGRAKLSPADVQALISYGD